jgi:hypothetical protein
MIWRSDCPDVFVPYSYNMPGVRRYHKLASTNLDVRQSVSMSSAHGGAGDYQPLPNAIVSRDGPIAVALSIKV